MNAVLKHQLEWEETLQQMLGKKNKNGRWTLLKFLASAKEIHGDQYNYSNIKEGNIQSVDNVILILCNTCNQSWISSVREHIHRQKGCSNCEKLGPVNTNLTRLLLEKFLNGAKEIHGNKFNYSKIKEGDVQDSESVILISCNICNHEWQCSVKDHIHSRKVCPGCKKVKPWNLERFLIRAREVHGDKYDYSEVEEFHIKGAKSHVPLKCRKCSYQWTTSIISHVNNKGNCPQCVGKAPWTLERFLIKSKEIHGNRYDYTLIHQKHIDNMYSRIPIHCTICDYIWFPMIHKHISGKRGCPKCNKSHGEIACEKVFGDMNISYQCQYEIGTLPNKKYDFMFTWRNKHYILEFDGQQHFIYCSHFHKNEDEFQKSQQRDMVKSRHAIRAGFFLIRIDYTQINNVHWHINNALIHLNEIYRVYYSNLALYEYIYTNLVDMSI